MNGEMNMPSVYSFSSITSADAVVWGFYRDNGIYLNSLLGNADTPQMIATILEEFCHHITKAKDGARDLQEWAFNIAAKTLKIG